MSSESSRTLCWLGICRQPGTKSCSKCHVARYCCREHQVAHWNEHNRDCTNVVTTRASFLREHFSMDEFRYVKECPERVLDAMCEMFQPMFKSFGLDIHQQLKPRESEMVELLRSNPLDNENGISRCLYEFITMQDMALQRLIQQQQKMSGQKKQQEQHEILRREREKLRVRDRDRDREREREKMKQQQKQQQQRERERERLRYSDSDSAVGVGVGGGVNLNHQQSSHDEASITTTLAAAVEREEPSSSSSSVSSSSSPPPQGPSQGSGPGLGAFSGSWSGPGSGPGSWSGSASGSWSGSDVEDEEEEENEYEDEEEEEEEEEEEGRDDDRSVVAAEVESEVEVEFDAEAERRAIEKELLEEERDVLAKHRKNRMLHHRGGRGKKGKGRRKKKTKTNMRKKKKSMFGGGVLIPEKSSRLSPFAAAESETGGSGGGRSEESYSLDPSRRIGVEAAVDPDVDEIDDDLIPSKDDLERLRENPLLLLESAPIDLSQFRSRPKSAAGRGGGKKRRRRKKRGDGHPTEPSEPVQESFPEADSAEETRLALKLASQSPDENQILVTRLAAAMSQMRGMEEDVTRFRDRVTRRMARLSEKLDFFHQLTVERMLSRKSKDVLGPEWPDAHLELKSVVVDCEDRLFNPENIVKPVGWDETLRLLPPDFSLLLKLPCSSMKMDLVDVSQRFRRVRRAVLCETTSADIRFPRSSDDLDPASQALLYRLLRLERQIRLFETNPECQVYFVGLVCPEFAFHSPEKLGRQLAKVMTLFPVLERLAHAHSLKRVRMLSFFLADSRYKIPRWGWD